MGVKARLVVYGEDRAAAIAAMSRAFDELARLDEMMSDYRPSSEVSRLVAAGGEWVPISSELVWVFSAAEDVSRVTADCFDITIGPCVQLWRRTRETHVLPNYVPLMEARSLVDWRMLWWDAQEKRARIDKAGMKIDLGGIAKGFAAQRALESLGAAGFPRSMVALAGDIAVGEAPPGTSGWRVEVRPSPGSPPVTLLLENACISTSGDTEQFIEIGGKRYSHIIDPRTGLGVTDGRAVTVVSALGEIADALSTALCIAPPAIAEHACAHWPATAAIVFEPFAPPRFVDPEHILRTEPAR